MANARLSISDSDSENVRIAHAGAFGNQYFDALVLFVQRGSQFGQDWDKGPAISQNQV
jgi:hypothetical protein